jgi:hypothetical protein
MNKISQIIKSPCFLSQGIEPESSLFSSFDDSLLHLFKLRITSPMYIKIEKMKLVARDRYNTKEGLNFSFKKDDNASTTIPIFITEPNLFLEVLKQYRIKYSIVDNPDLTEIERKYSNQIKADILIRKAGI